MPRIGSITDVSSRFKQHFSAQVLQESCLLFQIVKDIFLLSESTHDMKHVVSLHTKMNGGEMAYFYKMLKCNMLTKTTLNSKQLLIFCQILKLQSK